MSKEPRLAINEKMKSESSYLRGTIADTLSKDVTHFDSTENQLLKFHGIYQQDDRDLRMGLVKEKKEKAFSLMIRSKVPGGFLSPEQYLAHDEIADLYGGEKFRITDRQTIQFHGILKKNLKRSMQMLNEKLVTTLGACGDVVRNVLAPAAPFKKYKDYKLYEYALSLSNQFAPEGGAYQEVWLDGEKVDLDTDPNVVEPIYGATYLPRKFKIGIAIPGDNSVDALTHDLGVFAEIQNDEVIGFNLTVGGGMGMTHGNKETYPRLGSPFCFVKPEELNEVAKAIVIVQRDNGNRVNRKRARMKYLIDERGLDWFRGEVEKVLGRELEDVHPFEVGEIQRYHGWQDQGDGKWFLGVYVLNGRVKDEGGFKLKSLLKRIVSTYQSDVYLTPEQDIILSGFEENQKSEIENLFEEYGVSLPDEIDTIFKQSIACPALPTCGLAISESERVIGNVLSDIQNVLNDLGLPEQEISIRMTGCPNGCARPYNSEIAFVGKTAGTYNIYLGGSHLGNRLNEEFKEKVLAEDAANILKPVFEYYKNEREENERFGDFCHRQGIQKLASL